MTLKPKTLLLSLIAALAIGAVVAPGVQASAHFAWSREAKTATLGLDHLGASPNQVFTFGSLTVTCNDVRGAGALPELLEAEMLNISSLTYNNTEVGTGNEDKCKGPLSSTPSMEMNGCGITFKATQTIEPGNTSEITADGYIECTVPGSQIVMNGGLLCTIKVGEQGPLHHFRLKNEKDESGTESITVTATVEPEEGGKVPGISYTTSGLCGSGSGTDGKLAGIFTIEAENASEQKKSITVT